MKKSLFIAFFCILFLAACSNQNKSKGATEVEEVIEQVEEATDEAVDEAEEAIEEAGDAIEEATE